MLSSSAAYLQALREENYLLFLGWPDFIIQKYTDCSTTLNSDDVVNFLIFEWLNNEYSDEDEKKIALLYAVYELNAKPLRGKLDFSLSVITMSLYLCMLMKKENLIACFFVDKRFNSNDINELVKKNTALIDPLTFKDALEEIQFLFLNGVKTIDKKKVEAIFNKIDSITKIRYQMEDYILYLEQLKNTQDELYTARLSMARRFLSYMNEQTELLPGVTVEITAYIQAIRELSPNKEEEVYLTKISPDSTFTHAWRCFSSLGVGFFNYIFREKSIGELISGSSVTPEKFK